MIKRYGVLDAEGVKINTILIDDEKLVGYYPGYGAKLIDEGPDLQSAPEKYVPPEVPKDFGVIVISLAEPMEVGDRLDFATGKVEKRKTEAAAEAEVLP